MRESRCSTKAGRYGIDTWNYPNPVQEAFVEVDVVVSFLWNDGDVRQILNDYVEKHLLEAILER